MSFLFTPKNSDAGEFNIGAFTWPVMLERGLGLVLGYGKGFRPGTFIYITRPDNLCVAYNDGAEVTADESKELSKVARWIARIERARLNQWNEIPDEEKKRMQDAPHSTFIYDFPLKEQIVSIFEKFADWSEKSGGFTIK